MKKFFIVVQFISFLMLGNHVVANTPFTDNLSTCLVRATSDDDKKVLINWIFSVVSEHPDVENIVLSEKEKTILDIETADLMTSLLVKRCKSELLEAYKYEGDIAIETSFGVLGEIAMTGLMSNDKVLEAAQRFSKYIDESSFIDFLD